MLSMCFGCANSCFDFCEIAFQTVWKVGKDGIEAGTNLVPVCVFMFSKATLPNLLAVLFISTKLRYFSFLHFSILGFCTKTGSKDICHCSRTNCCALCTQIFPVYRFLRAGMLSIFCVLNSSPLTLFFIIILFK